MFSLCYQKIKIDADYYVFLLSKAKQPSANYLPSLGSGFPSFKE